MKSLNFSLKGLIATSITAAVFVSLILTGVVLLNTATSTVEQATRMKYQADLTSKGNMLHSRLSDYFITVEKQITTLAQTDSLKNAYLDLSRSFKSFDTQNRSLPSADSLNDYYHRAFKQQYSNKNSDQVDSHQLINSLSPVAKFYQAQWIADNPFPLGSKNNLVTLNDDSSYSKQHEIYHEEFNRFLTAFGFYDIFLVDAVSGEVIYSVFKELDFATNLLTGPYAGSGIAEAFVNGRDLALGESYLTDFKPYLPSYNDQASFMSSPIVVEGTVVGVLIFQMPLEKINQIMTHNENWVQEGFGASGETYLVGQDDLLRTESRFFLEDRESYLSLAVQKFSATADVMSSKQTTVGLQPVNTVASRAALNGQTGFQEIKDYRGVSVLSYYQPFKVEDLELALLTEIDLDEAMGSVADLNNGIVRTIVIMLVTMIVFFAVLSYFIAKALIKPLTGINDSLVQLNSAEADLSTSLPQSNIREINLIVGEFNAFITQLGSIVRQLKCQADVVATSSHQLSAITKQSSQTSVSQAKETESASAMVEKFLKFASDLDKSSSTAVETASRVQKLSKENANDANIAATEIRELETNVINSAEHLSTLSTQVENISQVLDVITSIAEQTNLLALNAAIEAARAGEHGRGFAVVADEVRALAAKTRQSTVEIKHTIEALTEVTNTTKNQMAMASGAASLGAQKVADVSHQLQQVWSEIINIDKTNQHVATIVVDQRSLCRELNGGMDRLLDSIQEMNQATKETESSAVGLSASAENVSEVVAKFTL